MGYISYKRWLCSPICEPVPARNKVKNQKSALEEASFVSEQIIELLSSGCVIEVNQSEVQVISPLGVVKNSSKKRLILDLRYVNKYFRISKFKYEDIQTMHDIFSLGDWFFKLDYRSGYHHVDIFLSHQKFLGFNWTSQGQKKWFVFSVFPFGLTSAPFVHTKIQLALIKHWQEQGVRIFTNLDNGQGQEGAMPTALAAPNMVKGGIAASGFIAHPEKCCWEPTQMGDLLGFSLNLSRVLLEHIVCL